MQFTQQAMLRRATDDVGDLERSLAARHGLNYDTTKRIVQAFYPYQSICLLG